MKQKFFSGFSAVRACGMVIALMLASGFGASAHAGEVEGLYEAQIPVASQREAERMTAIHTAFQEVVVKVTGDSRAQIWQQIEAVAQPSIKYVQQYLYRPLPPGYQPDATLAAHPTQMLWIRFDAGVVNQLLQQAGSPVWGRMRPNVLVWLAVEEPGARYLVSGDNHPELSAAVEDAAQRRGIPLLFPLLDLEDQSGIGFAEVWGGFPQELQRASARYQPDAILVGRLHRESDGQWGARWTLYLDADAQHWQLVTGRREELLVSGIDAAADILAQRFARASGMDETQSMDVVITDVEGFEDYGRAMDYLKALDGVAGLQVTQVDANGVHFHLVLHTDRTRIAQAIHFGNVLAPVQPDGMEQQPGAGALPPPDQELTYRLRP